MMKSSGKFVVISERLFDNFKAIFYLGRFFGLAPMACHRGKSIILRQSLFWRIYSYCIMVFFVSTSIYCWTQLVKYENVFSIRFKEATSRYVTISDIGIVLLSSFLGVLVSSWNSDKFSDFLNCLTTIDSLLRRFPDAKASKYLFMTLFSMLLTTCILCFDSYMWITIADKYQKNVLFLSLQYIPYYVCYYYTLLMELIYWHVIDFIKARLCVLDKKLADLDDLNANKSSKKFNMIIDTLNFAETSTKKPISLRDAEDLIFAYEKLIEASNKINEYSGLMILIVICGCLVHLLVTPYALYAIIQNTGNSLFIISQAIWMIGHVLRLLLIVEPCHGCSIQLKSITETVYKLLTRDLRPDVRSYFDLFAMYLMQCKIEFTAYDFTIIDRFFLTTVAGTVSTYLVILFQFNK